MNAKSQKIEGNILVDNISTLDLSLKNESSYSGTINNENVAKTLSVELDSNSVLTLTGDSYITALNNEVSDNSNINLNGHILYVDGTAITSTNYKNVAVNNTENNIQKIIIISSIAGLAILSGVIVTVIVIKKKNVK